MLGFQVGPEDWPQRANAETGDSFHMQASHLSSMQASHLIVLYHLPQRSYWSIIYHLDIIVKMD